MTDKNALLTDKVELTKQIDIWGAAGKKWADRGHFLAMSAMTILAKTGDIGPVNRVLLAMPKGTKVTAMLSWMLTHGPLIQTEDQSKAKDQPVTFTKDKQGDLAAAAQDPWFNHKPETAQDPVFDLQKALEAVIAKAKGKELVHGELLTGVQGLLSMLATTNKVDETDEEPDAE